MKRKFEHLSSCIRFIQRHVKWYLLEVRRTPWNPTITLWSPAWKVCLLLCWCAWATGLSAVRLCPARAGHLPWCFAFPACCWLSRVLSCLSPWTWKLEQQSFLTQRFFLPSPWPRERAVRQWCHPSNHGDSITDALSFPTCHLQDDSLIHIFWPLCSRVPR